MDAFLIRIFFAFLIAALIVVVVETIHLLVRPRSVVPLVRSLVFRDWLNITGQARFGVLYIEKALFLALLWMLLGLFFWPGIQWLIALSIWWAWRKGILR